MNLPSAISAAPAALVSLQINSDQFVGMREAGITSSSPLGLFIANGAALFWTVAYVCVIVHAFREKRPMIPAVAILLNVGWELAAVFEWPSYNTDMRFGAILWLMVDLIIVYQLFRFGGRHQGVAELRRYWYWAVFLGILFSLGGHSSFAVYNGDEFGLEDSYLINLVMSILFVRMYFTYQDTSKLARWIAWTKMLGTLCGSVGLTIMLNSMDPPWPRSLWFLYYLMIACFGFDMIYIGLVSRRRSQQGAEGAAVVAAAA
jgi:hypothetical protein